MCVFADVYLSMQGQEGEIDEEMGLKRREMTEEGSKYWGHSDGH